MDDERRRWLETLAAACERILAEPPGHDGADGRALMDGAADLLARIRPELDAATQPPETEP